MTATGDDQWRPFNSTQRVITQRPGFDWEARIAMLPGLPVRVHDAYIAGEGMLHASLFGLVSVAICWRTVASKPDPTPTVKQLRPFVLTELMA